MITKMFKFNANDPLPLGHASLESCVEHKTT